LRRRVSVRSFAPEVSESLGVEVAVRVGLIVGVLDGELVGLIVGVLVGVFVGVRVNVRVGVSVGVDVPVIVGVGLCAEATEPRAQTPIATTAESSRLRAMIFFIRTSLP
jgi:hypothetical protein